MKKIQEMLQTFPVKANLQGRPFRDRHNLAINSPVITNLWKKSTRRMPAVEDRYCASMYSL
jgi:hypothetical protein